MKFRLNCVTWAPWRGPETTTEEEGALDAPESDMEEDIDSAWRGASRDADFLDADGSDVDALFDAMPLADGEEEPRGKLAKKKTLTPSLKGKKAKPTKGKGSRRSEEDWDEKFDEKFDEKEAKEENGTNRGPTKKRGRLPSDAKPQKKSKK